MVGRSLKKASKENLTISLTLIHSNITSQSVISLWRRGHAYFSPSGAHFYITANQICVNKQWICISFTAARSKTVAERYKPRKGVNRIAADQF